jgi:hypothetical protein
MDFLRQYLDTRLVWASWIAASVVSTSLLVQGTGELPFPRHLLLAHLIVASIITLILYAVNWYNSPIYLPLEPSKTWPSIDISSLLLSILMAPILIVAYKTLTHANDLSNVILIFTLDWRPADLFGKLLEWKLKASDVARYLIFAAGLYFICVCNFRLRFVPWLMAMEVFAFTGLAQLALHWKVNLSRPFIKPAEERYPALPKYWVLISLVAVVTSFYLEPERIHPDRSPVSTIAIITAVSGVVVTGTLFALASSFQDLENRQESSFEDEDYSPRFEGALLRLAVAGFVIVSDSLSITQPLNISYWQYLGYIVAALAFLTWEETKQGLHGLAKTINQVFRGQGVTTGACTLAFLILVGGAWIYALLQPLVAAPIPLEYTNLPLDPAPFPASDLDIVISRYAEPAAEVARTLDTLLAAESIRTLPTRRVLIYNKNTDTADFERDLLTHLTSNVNVSCHALENVGREADAYLRHTLQNWDNLAHHTLFAQAELDGFSEVIPWIEKFFVPETGFLHLSYEGRMCANCAHCGSWTDDPNVISTLFSLSNPTRQCRNLVWTFRGQFIVSGPRLRANGKGIYEQLIQNLTDPGNAMHAPEYVGGVWHSAQHDSVNDPVFGFTVERFWGILMQCSEPRVGFQSPSALAIMRRPKWLPGGYGVDLAQCLDRPREEL